MNDRHGPPQPQQINVDISAAEDIKCAVCGNWTFQPVFFFKKLSAIQSPSGKASLVPIDTFCCAACGNINLEFMPKWMAEKVLNVAGTKTEEPKEEAPKSNLISLEN